jgi:glycosyltransferase involved in cell wall biosynthesis
MSETLLSIFTPTNDPTHLFETYDSIKIQDYPHWEWVIVPNGDMSAPVPPEITQDERVRIVPDPGTDSIGALKLAACQACKGDAFIELDHDDLLVPGILAKIAAAIDGGAGFVYSDSAVFNDGTLKTWAYSPTHGWESYDLRVYDKPFKATRTFELSPRSLCEVYYAPDHVRVWSRKAYEKTGGHDPSLPVADDHDLICRTYLAGEKFHYLDCCGYLYRYHEKNTVKQRGQQIQKLQAENRRKYLHPLAIEWSRRNDLKTFAFNEFLELVEGWDETPELDFPDNSVGHFVAWDCLQFLPPKAIVPFFNEAYRVLAPGGVLSLALPSADGLYAFQDPRHLSRFNANSLLYYTQKEFAKVNPEIKCQFQSIQTYTGFPSTLYEKHNMLMVFSDLCALKGQRQPGPQHI